MLSNTLEISLRRALSIATDHHHEYATYEHLLLALLDDADAKKVLNYHNIKIDKLAEDLSNYVDLQLQDLVSEFSGEAKPTAGFQRIIQRAALHAQSYLGGAPTTTETLSFESTSSSKEHNSDTGFGRLSAIKKRMISGADLLAEFFFEHETYALHALKNLGLTRHDILEAIKNLENFQGTKLAFMKSANKLKDQDKNDGEAKDKKQKTDYSTTLDNYAFEGDSKKGDSQADSVDPKSNHLPVSSSNSAKQETSKQASNNTPPQSITGAMKHSSNLHDFINNSESKSAYKTHTSPSRSDELLEEDLEEKEAKEELEKYCVNLNEKAKTNDIDCLVGRHNEVQRTIEILCRRKKNNAILVGEPGVGKTAIAEGLAYRIAKNDVPKILQDTLIYALDIGALVAGTKYRGDFEERIRSMLEALKNIKSAVLFIDEIHSIIGAGSTTSGSLDASNLLKPALARGELKCIGSTTFKEFHNHFEKDMALVRRFQKIVVEEPDEESTMSILNGLKPYYEKHHNVKYDESALKAAISLSQRYINDRHLPDKAIDLIDEAGSRCKISANNKRSSAMRKKSLAAEASNEQLVDANLADMKTASGDHNNDKGDAKVAKPNLKQETPKVTEKDIENVITTMLNIPNITVVSDDIKQLKKLENNLKKSIFGQDEAIRELCNSIKLSRAGLRKGSKPTGCYLFAGKTGVGKTELAKQLALVCSMRLVKFDMSEFSESASVSKLIGSAPGYVGFDQGGLLTEEVDKYPYSVILFDEIEKAHPDIYNLLLQIMDEGCLTDSTGKTVDFTYSMIVLTTNIQAEKKSMQIGFAASSTDSSEEEQGKSPKSKTKDESSTSEEKPNMSNFEAVFSPEFRSRLDKIILFNEIDGIIDKIVDKNFKDLASQLADKKVSISVSKAVKKHLIENCFDNKNGAREIDKIIDSEIKQYIADEILFGRLKDGGSITIDFNKAEGKITFDFNKASLKGKRQAAEAES